MPFLPLARAIGAPRSKAMPSEPLAPPPCRPQFGALRSFRDWSGRWRNRMPRWDHPELESW